MNLLSHNPILFLILYAVIAVGLIAVPQIGFKKTSASRTIGFTAQLIGLCLATLSFAGIITLEYAPGAAIFFGALALLFGWGYVVIKAHIFVHDAYDCFLLLGVGMWVQSVGWIFFWLAVIIFNSDAQPINYYIFFVASKYCYR